ncbi:MAG: aminoacyl-histidine dipeptidase [Melioribacteraceae bacterium]|jgi:dipeptidase D|nr:aminoacyl-histidine dipeptidase [Melioribacteraceae bacterium]
MNAIESLSPHILWKRFYEISQIPRNSKNEEQIRQYLKSFAEHHGFTFNEDSVGNIVIHVPPTPGKENLPTIVLQSHVDMVCEKNRDTIHDFSKDPIKLVKDGEWIKADGTTLGADNGIGAAASLAVAGEEDFEHGPLELLFTVDEETGLTGANNLQPGFITGKLLLNLDTEEDGAFYVGCAGGMDTAGILPIEFEKINEKLSIYNIFISGLKGGHSGININDGRANAIKLMAHLLKNLKSFEFQIVQFVGGSKRNAIPREAEATILIDAKYESEIREAINEFAINTSLQFRKAEDEIKISIDKKDFADITFKNAFSIHFRDKLINTIIALPHGVVAMSSEIPGLVETSTNLATVVQNENEIIIGTSQRSSIESSKKSIASVVESVLRLAGAKVKVGDGYPGWQPNMKSPLLKKGMQIYRIMFSKEPVIKAVHAGLECGILGDRYPGLDMLSLGPTIEGAHSPDERVNIVDVEKFYRLLKEIIRSI